jgi:hypothetical protein
MKKNKHLIWRLIYKLHRYIGLLSAIVLIMLAITGIALNHTEDLKLDSQMIQSKIILDWYGINSPDNQLSYSTEHHWLTQINQQLYFDHKLLLENTDTLLGVVETNDFVITALSHSLLLLSLEGELIEQSPFNEIEKIGLDQQQRIVIKSSETTVYSDDGLLSWHPHNNLPVKWSETSAAPESIVQNIKNNFRSSILPLERVLLDIHSGRFFGSAGVIIVDISGIMLLILALSGCAIWLKHKLRELKRS